MSEVQTGQDTPDVITEDQTPATTPETVETPPVDTQAQEDVQTEVAKTVTMTQEEFDAKIKAEKAKAEAKAERRVMKALQNIAPQPVQQPIQQQVDQPPTRDQYDSEEAYLDAKLDWKLEQRDRETKQVQIREKTQSLATKTENLYKEAAKIEGFDRDDFEQLPLTPVIAQALIDSDEAPKLMAYMASNPEEVERISALSPARQAAELGKLEAKLTSVPAKTSKAPAPIAPVGGAKTTTKNIANMSQSEYEAHRMKQNPAWAR